jgi:hypothetical protein
MASSGIVAARYNPLRDMVLLALRASVGVNGSRVAGGDDRNRPDRAPYHKTALSSGQMRTPFRVARWRLFRILSSVAQSKPQDWPCPLMSVGQVQMIPQGRQTQLGVGRATRPRNDSSRGLNCCRMWSDVEPQAVLTEQACGLVAVLGAA